MKASLALNHKSEIALFYTEALASTPEWASIDVEQGELYLGGNEMDSQFVKLDKIDERIYERIKTASKILLVRVRNDKDKTPEEAITVPLMVSRQL